LVIKGRLKDGQATTACTTAQTIIAAKTAEKQSGSVPHFYTFALAGSEKHYSYSGNAKRLRDL